jgi:hypothetical protein
MSSGIYTGQSPEQHLQACHSMVFPPGTFGELGDFQRYSDLDGFQEINFYLNSFLKLIYLLDTPWVCRFFLSSQQPSKTSQKRAGEWLKW